MSKLTTTVHYLTAILERLSSLYELLPDDPRLREHISDEVDWVEAEIARLNGAALPEPDGLENLKAIMADQPYRNSALSVHEIDTILMNKGGFMPDEAVIWFRENRASPLSRPKRDSPA